MLGGKWTALREYKATPEMVASWFKQKPDINFGLIMGTPFLNGTLVAVDYDFKPKELPITPMIQTSRGYNVLFVANKDDLPERSYKGACGEQKKSGYIVSAPSIHPEGKKYEWPPFLSPLDLKPADFKEHWPGVRQQLTKIKMSPGESPLDNSANKGVEKEGHPSLSINTRVVFNEVD